VTNFVPESPRFVGIFEILILLPSIFAFYTMSDILVAKYALEIQEELPTIYMSIKNLITYVVGKNYDQRIVSGFQISPQNVMVCAKYLLQAVRAYQLPSVEQFAAANPSCSSDELSKYMAVCEVCRSLAEKGGKVGRVLGRSYFLWTKSWVYIKQIALELIQHNAPAISLADISLVLDTYETSLNLEEPNPEKDHLIWASDVNIVLSGMQRERMERTRTGTDDLSILESQLFMIPSLSSSAKVSRPASMRVKQGPPSLPSLWTNCDLNGMMTNASNPCSPNAAAGIAALERSRAPTMEHLGLEFQVDLFRSRSQDEHQNHGGTVHMLGVPIERSRATTMDIFCTENQPALQFSSWSNTPY